MQRLLENKVVVVTGAGRGIGRGIAMLAAAHGARVVVNDLGGAEDGSGQDAGPAASVVDEIRAAGGEAVANGASVADWDAAHGIVASAIDNFGQANYAAAKLGIVGLSKSMALDMGRFRVRSNCIAPFAWSRLIGTIPTRTEEEQARVAKIQQMTPDKIAPLAIALCSDAAAEVTGQIFGVRNNEIFLFNQNRPIRYAHQGEGWTAEQVLDRALPAFAADFTPLERSGDVFRWDPM